MANLVQWDESGKRFYETGVKNCVLYTYDSTATNNKYYSNGVAWNGITGITESPSGAEETALYADDIKYLSLRSAEEFGFTIEAYTYPDEWALLDGSASPVAGLTFGQQSRGLFGICYKTVLGNDAKLDSYAYKLHLIYGATASPSERAYASINDSPEAITFSWEASTTPVTVSDITIDGTAHSFKPVSCITIDSSDFTDATAKAKLTALETKLYGTAAAGETEAISAYMPLPNEVYTTLTQAAG